MKTTKELESQLREIECQIKEVEQSLAKLEHATEFYSKVAERSHGGYAITVITQSEEAKKSFILQKSKLEETARNIKAELKSLNIEK